MFTEHTVLLSLLYVCEWHTSSFQIVNLNTFVLPILLQ